MRAGAQGLHGLDDGFDRRRAQFEPGDIVGGVDRFLAVADLPETAGDAGRRNVVAVLFGVLADVGTETAAHGFEHRIGIVEEEGQGVDQELLVDLGKGTAAGALHATHLDHVGQFGFVAERAAAEQLDLDPAVAGLLALSLNSSIDLWRTLVGGWAWANLKVKSAADAGMAVATMAATAHAVFKTLCAW